MIPETLEECYIELDKILEKEDLNNWISSSEEHAIAISHHSVGMWIRNNWGLWSGSNKLKDWFIKNEIHHPDDMSGIILTSYHRYKNNKDIKLEEQFEHTINYYLSDRQKLLRKRTKKLKIINENH